MTNSTSTISTNPDPTHGGPLLPNGDPARDPRSEVNAYASEILTKLLTIVQDLPSRRRDELVSFQHEIREMLAFIDPTAADRFDDIPYDTFVEDDSDSTASLTMQPATEQIEMLLNRVERVDLHAAASVELLRDLRVAVETLRDELRSHNDAANRAVESLTSTTRSLHYTMTAISARSEQITDHTGIVAEELRVGLWKYALIAGLSSGAIVAAVVAFLNLVA